MHRHLFVAAALVGLALPLTALAQTKAARPPNPDLEAELDTDVEVRVDGELVFVDIPEAPAELGERMLQYQNTRSAALEGWESDDDGLIIRTRFGEMSQVHRVASPLGAREQLTFFAEPVRSAWPRPTPAHDGFALVKDIGGNEAYQIYYHDRSSGETRLLTDGESRYGGPVWSNDGGRMAITTTARNGEDWDVLVMDPAFPEGARVVRENEGAWYVLDWSPDDDRILMLNYVSSTESHIHTLDVATGELTVASTTLDDGTTVAHNDTYFTPDGAGLYITRDAGTEFLTLRRLDLASGEETQLTDESWDVDTMAPSPDREWLAVVRNEGGISRLSLIEGTSGATIAIPGLPVGQIYDLRWSNDGRKLGMVLNTAQTPGDVYVLDAAAATAGGTDDLVERWTRSEVGGLDTDGFVLPELVAYPTFDKDESGAKREIPAFVYKPAGAGPHPVVISIHGGPESQFKPWFSSMRQFLVLELGVVLIAPNVRGSSGYGKTWLQLDNGMQREDSVKDIGALLEWIATQPEMDPDRVVVMGGSYGGYMVLASLIHYGDRLAGGIDMVGISSFVTFLENTKAYRRDLRRVEYGDEREPEMRAFLEAISPLSRAHEIAVPLLVGQGANDPRVPVGEAEQIVSAVRKNGGDVWYLLAKDEGHGFRKKSNRNAWEQSIVLFLERVLGGDSE